MKSINLFICAGILINSAGWTMEQESNNQLISSDDAQKELASSPLSLPTFAEIINLAFKKTIQTGCDAVKLGLNKLNKNTDPIDYSTGPISQEIYKIAIREFNQTKNITDYEKLLNYKAKEGEPERASGDLCQKSHNRIASYNIAREILKKNIIKQNKFDREVALKALGLFIEKNQDIINTVSTSYTEMEKRILNAGSQDQQESKSLLVKNNILVDENESLYPTLEQIQEISKNNN